MAITLTVFEDYFDAALQDEGDNFVVFAAAQKGDRAAIHLVSGMPQFVAEATTTTDTSNAQVVDLTDQGVTFPADTVRRIRCRSFCSTDNDHYSYEWEEDVLGGSTPVLLGQRILNGWTDENGTVGAYGHVKFQATVTALTTLTTIFASPGLAMGDIVNGDSDFTIPKSRLCIPLFAGLSGPSVFTASTAGWNVIVDPALLTDGAGTDAIQFANSTGTLVTSTDPVLGGIVTLAFEIWPPFNHRLVINTANVEVQCTAVDAIGDDVLRHRVEVFVGKLTRLKHHS